MVAAPKTEREQRPPIFSLEQHRWDDRRGGSSAGSVGDAQQVVVGNSLMVVALPHCRVLRWRVNRDQPPEEIEVCKPHSLLTSSSGGNKKDSIAKLFMDPRGFHLLVCLVGGDVYYLHARSGKAKRLDKWRGVFSGGGGGGGGGGDGGGAGAVESVAFDAKHVSESTTRALLIGTDRGCLFESVVDSSGKTTTPTLHYQLSPPLRICALHVTSVGGSGGGSEGLGLDGGNNSADSEGGGGQGGSGAMVAGGNSGPGGGCGGEGGGCGGGSGGGGGGTLFVMLATDAPTRLYSFLSGPTYADMFGSSSSSSASSSGGGGGMGGNSKGPSPSSWSFTELGALKHGRKAELQCFAKVCLRELECNQP